MRIWVKNIKAPISSIVYDIYNIQCDIIKYRQRHAIAIRLYDVADTIKHRLINSSRLAMISRFLRPGGDDFADASAGETKHFEFRHQYYAVATLHQMK